MTGDNKFAEGKGISQFWQKLQRHAKLTKSEEAKEHNTSPILNISHPLQKGVLAKVVLNGYNIEQAGSLGSLGAMRSFKIVRGDLWDEWNEQTAVILTDEQGQEIFVKVAALPVDRESFGLIEFISQTDTN